MRIIMEGNTFSCVLSDLCEVAFYKIAKIIEKENPELYKQLSEYHATPIVSAVIDVGFQNKEGDEPQILATDAGEVLTFKFSVDNEMIKLEGDNMEEPLFTDTDRAIVDLAEGLTEVAHTIDVTGVPVEYQTHVGGLDVTIYGNGVVNYYKDNKLVQEATVQPDKLEDFINEVKRLVGDN